MGGNGVSIGRGRLFDLKYCDLVDVFLEIRYQKHNPSTCEHASQLKNEELYHAPTSRIQFGQLYS